VISPPLIIDGGRALTGFSTTDLFILIILLVVLIVLAIFMPRFLIMNAMKRVIKTLIKNDALSPQNAQTAEQLGIRQGAIWDNMFRIRDYRPQALAMLVESEIIVNTIDGRYYLSKEKLKISRFKDMYQETDY
jgi:hypothetical protein